METWKLTLVSLVLVACNKTEGTGASPSATAEPAPLATIAITGTPVAATASAPASASASASAPAPAPASASAPASAPASASARASASASAPLKPASTKISGKNFSLEVASPGCRVEAPCTMTLTLATTGEYHVNKEYPYKFVATAAPGVTYLADASTFSRTTGDFKEEGERSATMTVRFKPTSAGEAKIAGTYKMSVCSAENCQIEQQAVSLSVPVL